MNNENMPINPLIEGNNQSTVNRSMFKIATNNVRGLNEPVKQLQVINYMKIQAIDIMGLSETRLSKNTAGLLYRNESLYRAWWNCDPNPNQVRNFTGVGLIFNSYYSKYVQNIQGYKGRVIHAKLFLKGQYKLFIVQVYIHANDTNKEDKLDLYRYIKNIIT